MDLSKEVVGESTAGLQKGAAESFSGHLGIE